MDVKYFYPSSGDNYPFWKWGSILTLEAPSLFVRKADRLKGIFSCDGTFFLGYLLFHSLMISQLLGALYSLVWMRCVT